MTDYISLVFTKMFSLIWYFKMLKNITLSWDLGEIVPVHSAKPSQQH